MIIRHRVRFLALAVAIAACSASAATLAWPALPDHGFLAGRAATEKDIAAGNAVFSAGGKPLDILIPQYAYYVADGAKQPVIIVQAEAAGGIKIFGARAIAGGDIVGTDADFELLGKMTPKPTKP